MYLKYELTGRESNLNWVWFVFAVTVKYLLSVSMGIFSNFLPSPFSEQHLTSLKTGTLWNNLGEIHLALGYGEEYPRRCPKTLYR